MGNNYIVKLDSVDKFVKLENKTSQLQRVCNFLLISTENSVLCSLGGHGPEDRENKDGRGGPHPSSSGKQGLCLVTVLPAVTGVHGRVGLQGQINTRLQKCSGTVTQIHKPMGKTTGLQ